uniref:Knottin scorpion toxin-like domain-containing protein n=1 Tax=Oryza brachyantha TaxID=4533 RepID=J3NAC6_ORYBR
MALCLVAVVIVATAFSSCKADESTDVCFWAGLRPCQVNMCAAYCLKGGELGWKHAYCNGHGKCCCPTESTSPSEK